MLEAVAFLDDRTAGGVLARAALSLSDAENPAAEETLENEAAIRNAVISEARSQLGLDLNDQSQTAIDQIGDLLDNSADEILGPVDASIALMRLAAKGSLPSDLYSVSIAEPTLLHFVGDLEFEKQLIIATVKNPDKEQYLSEADRDDDLSAAAFFVRKFHTKWPFKDFLMLVIGIREQLELKVHRALRVYPSLLNGAEGLSPLDLLRAFTELYGNRIEVDGQQGTFFLSVQSIPKMVQTKRNVNNQTDFLFRNATQGRPLSRSLVFSVDTAKYNAVLDKMMVSRHDIEEDVFRPKIVTIDNPT